MISQPAFAYDAPTVTQNGIVEIRLVDSAPSARYDVFVTQNALASCPGSATNLPPGGAVVINRVTVVTSLAMQSGFTWWADANIAGAGTAVPPGATQTVSYTFPSQPVTERLGRVRKRVSTPPRTNTPVVSGDSFRVDVTYTFGCTYSDGTTRTNTATFSDSFTA